MGAIASPESSQPMKATAVRATVLPRARSMMSWRLGLETSNQGWLTRR